MWREEELQIDIPELAEIEALVFPNPAQNYIFINTKEPITKVQILNFNGQVILEQNSGEIDVERLASGTYIIKGYTSTNGRFTKKIVKL